MHCCWSRNVDKVAIASCAWEHGNIANYHFIDFQIILSIFIYLWCSNSTQGIFFNQNRRMTRIKLNFKMHILFLCTHCHHKLTIPCSSNWWLRKSIKQHWDICKLQILRSDHWWYISGILMSMYHQRSYWCASNISKWL